MGHRDFTQRNICNFQNGIPELSIKIAKDYFENNLKDSNFELADGFYTRSIQENELELAFDNVEDGK